MPAQRLSMRQVRAVLRLKHVAGPSERRIAAAIGISRYTVAEYLRRATVVGITWPVPAELDDSALEVWRRAAFGAVWTQAARRPCRVGRGVRSVRDGGDLADVEMRGLPTGKVEPIEFAKRCGARFDRLTAHVRLTRLGEHFTAPVRASASFTAGDCVEFGFR
jgi:hypothetical protein